MRYISIAEAKAIHDQQLALFGGTAGIIDEGKLESALFRPVNIANYNQSASLCDLAAALGYGIAINHPFLDGNKRTAHADFTSACGRSKQRTAFIVMAVFLELNGASLMASEVEVVEIMLGIATGKVTEEELSLWLEHNLNL